MDASNRPFVHTRLRAAFALFAILALTITLAPPAASQPEDAWRQQGADEQRTRQSTGNGPDAPGLKWFLDLAEVETAFAPDGYTYRHGSAQGPADRVPIAAPDGTLVLLAQNNDPQYEQYTSGVDEAIGIQEDEGSGEPRVAWEIGNATWFTGTDTGKCIPAIDSRGRLWVTQPPEDGTYRLQAFDTADGEPIDGASVAVWDADLCGRVAPLHVAGEGADERLVVPGAGDPSEVTVIDVSGETVGDADAWGLDDPDLDVLANVPGPNESVYFDPFVSADGSLYTVARTEGSLEIVELTLDDGTVASRMDLPAPEPTGDEEWQPNDYLRAHLLLAGDTLVVSPTQEPLPDVEAPSYLAAVDVSSGLTDDAVRWVERMPDDADQPTDVLSLGDGVALTRNDGHQVNAFDLDDGAPVWSIEGRLHHHATPTDARGYGYTVTREAAVWNVDDYLIGFDADGGERWRISPQSIADEAGVDSIDDLNFAVRGQFMHLGPIDGDGTLYAMDRDHDGILAIDNTGGLSDVDPDQVGGADRYETADQLAREFDAADTVVIARGDDFPDALAGAPLASSLEAPILLSRPEGLTDGTLAEIARLGATDARLLGGEAALSAAVRTQLEDAGLTVERYEGANRFETAALIAEDVPGEDAAYVARGIAADPDAGWEDAVAVSALAAFTETPILLTATDGLPGQTAVALEGRGEATIVGGEAVVAPAVQTEIEDVVGEVDRLAGLNRWETSADIADASLAAGMDPSTVWVATGLNFPDSLAAAPVVGAAAPEIAAASGGVLLLINGEDLERSEASEQWLSDNAADIDRIRAVGGPAVVSADALAAARAAAGVE